MVDLCCGNGLITAVLAPCVDRSVGVDFSSRLLEVAARCYGGHNIDYKMLDLTQPSSEAFEGVPPVTKVCFHTAIQYFSTSQVKDILMFLQTIGKGEEVKVRTRQIA